MVNFDSRFAVRSRLNPRTPVRSIITHAFFILTHLVNVEENVTSSDDHSFNGEVFPDVLGLAHFVVHLL